MYVGMHVQQAGAYDLKQAGTYDAQQVCMYVCMYNRTQIETERTQDSSKQEAPAQTPPP